MLVDDDGSGVDEEGALDSNIFISKGFASPIILWANQSYALCLSNEVEDLTKNVLKDGDTSAWTVYRLAQRDSTSTSI